MTVDQSLASYRSTFGLFRARQGGQAPAAGEGQRGEKKETRTRGVYMS